MGYSLATIMSINQKGKVVLAEPPTPAALGSPSNAIIGKPPEATHTTVTTITSKAQTKVATYNAGWPEGWQIKTDKERGTLYIAAIPFAAMLGWFLTPEHKRKEIAGFGSVEKRTVGKGEEATVEDVMVWASHVAIGQSGAVHISHPQTATSMALLKAHNEEKGLDLPHNLQWHTHPEFNPFWSGTDLTDQRETITDAVDISPDKGIFYFIVFDRLHFVGRLFHWENFRDNKTVNQRDLDVRLAVVKESFLAPISTPTTTVTYYGGGYQANTPWYQTQRNAAKKEENDSTWKPPGQRSINYAGPIGNQAPRVPVQRQLPGTVNPPVPPPTNTSVSNKNDKPLNTKPVELSKGDRERLATLYGFLGLSEDTAFLDRVEFDSMEYASWALMFADLYFLQDDGQSLLDFELEARKLQNIFNILERFKMDDVLRWARNIFVQGVIKKEDSLARQLAEEEAALDANDDDVWIESVAAALAEAFDMNDLVEFDILTESFDLDDNDIKSLIPYFKLLDRDDIATYLATRWATILSKLKHTVH